MVEIPKSVWDFMVRTYQENPELTVRDVAEKFGYPIARVRAGLKTRLGQLRKEHRGRPKKATKVKKEIVAEKPKAPPKRKIIKFTHRY